MIIQNLMDTLTGVDIDFDHKAYDFFKRDNAPYLIDEYFITHTKLSEYETRVAVLDEDQNMIASAVVDIYDDIAEAERQLAFVASLSSSSVRNAATVAQLKAMLAFYDEFVASAAVPKDYYREDFEDLRVVQRAVSYVHAGMTVEQVFTVRPATRKRQFTDYYANHRFRPLAEKIAQAYLDAA